MIFDQIHNFGNLISLNLHMDSFHLEPLSLASLEYLVNIFLDTL